MASAGVEGYYKCYNVPTTKDCRAPNVQSAKVRKPCSKAFPRWILALPLTCYVTWGNLLNCSVSPMPFPATKGQRGRLKGNLEG